MKSILLLRIESTGAAIITNTMQAIQDFADGDYGRVVAANDVLWDSFEEMMDLTEDNKTPEITKEMEKTYAAICALQALVDFAEKQ